MAISTYKENGPPDTETPVLSFIFLYMNTIKADIQPIVNFQAL